MGIKDLWSILTPYADRKPINELHGKKVAIDLAGWVCESLNVVDHFIHPKHHLKNLFFRTCYLLWEDVVPVFVLDGIAPELKGQVIRQRQNERNFRGVEPRDKPAKTQSNNGVNAAKGRTNFNRTLGQCKSLLQCMGMQCVQAPGEAESYCAFLNKRGLVDGVISQDSDCFAYGALCVFRNFSVSMQGKMAAHGGAIDIYDAENIHLQMGLGQQKYIAMALLCGCDYCPEGVGGVGKEGVLQLFRKYDNNQILDRLRSWRSNDGYYNAMEMRVNDKSICSNCGHIGRTQTHTKRGCDVCRTQHGCDATLWKCVCEYEREALKSELMLRKKSLAVASFPNEEIIAEFLKEPAEIPELRLDWKQPNILWFIQRCGALLQWPEIYCFQKFLPILTRWQLYNSSESNSFVVEPHEILKKRTVRSIPSLEIMWRAKHSSIAQIIPEDQLLQYEEENSKSAKDLWITVEPFGLVEKCHYDAVAAFIESHAPKKSKKTGEGRKKTNNKNAKPKTTIDKFFNRNVNVSTPLKSNKKRQLDISLGQFPSDLESDCENLDISNIISDIVSQRVRNPQHFYQNVKKSLLSKPTHADDNDVMMQKRKSAIVRDISTRTQTSLDDSFDVLMKNGDDRLRFINNLKCSENINREDDLNSSSFFNTPNEEADHDAFEMALNISQGLQGINEWDNP